MKKLALFTAAALLLTVLLPSCAENDNKENPDTTSSFTSAETTEAVTEGPVSSIEAVDLDGETITFMTYILSSIDHSSSIDLFPDEDTNTATAIDDALEKRNTAICEKFDIKFDYNDIEQDNQINYLTQMMQAGDFVNDIIISSMASATSMGIAGLLTPINEAPYIDLDHEWWYPNVMDETSIHGNYFFVIGDFNWHSWNTTFCMYFNQNFADDVNLNKRLSDSYGYNNLYELVSAGQWTYDKLFELSSSYYNDANGDSTWDEFDTFGFSNCCDCVEAFLAGVEIRFIVKDEDDTPYFTVPDNFYTFFPAFNAFLNSDSTFFSDRPQYLSRWGEVELNVFRDGRALFYDNTLYSGNLALREMEDNYGIIPMPKYDEAQAEYCTYNHFSNNTCLSIPLNVKDIDVTGMIIEDLGYFSSIYIPDAYFEKTLDGKLARDDESWEMLDLILSHYQYDLTNYLYFEGIQLTYNTLRLAVRNNSTAITSSIAKSVKIFQKMLNNVIDEIDANYTEK